MQTQADRSNPSLVPALSGLFDGQVEGLVVTLCENERPPAGLSGLLDWYFKGALSQFLRSGAITGQEGECIYLPVKRVDRIYHLIFAGVGPSRAPGDRQRIPSLTLQTLKKNLSTLKLPKVGLSQADFGEPNPQFLEKNLKGVSLWIAP